MDIEPIPYFYESIDRNAIVVRPKKPFYDWLNKIFQDNEAVSDKDENNIYLIREMISNEQVNKWIKNNFDMIFNNELNDWYTDEKKWPQKRSYKMFSDWFDIEICSMVLDLEGMKLEKIKIEAQCPTQAIIQRGFRFHSK